jgi:hypothetical protein
MNVIKLHASPRPTAPPVEHLLRAISNTRSGSEEQWALQKRAYLILADLNGWKVDGKKRWCPFNDKTLQDHHFFDHQIVFNEAFVIQPYGHRDWRNQAETAAATQRRPLAVHFPPIALASIYAPGNCAFIVFTKPGHVIRWLPEQISGIAGRDRSICSGRGTDQEK